MERYPARVSLAQCAEYDPREVNRAIDAALEPFGGIRNIVPSGARVLVKINLLNASSPERAVVTHPEITRAVIRLIKRAGAEPIVGEQAGPSLKGITLKAIQASGTGNVCEAEGVLAVPFHNRGFEPVTVHGNRHLTTLHVAREVVDADMVIGIAKLKTHAQALFTGTIKNYFGCIPLRYRREAHGLGRFRPFCEALVDVFRAVRPSFTFLDGIVGMEGTGPNRGSPKKLGVLLAAEDHVACDAVAMDLIGLDPERYPLLEDARARGLGENRLARIEVFGPAPDSLRSTFEPPPRFLLNPPAFLARVATWILTQKPKVDPERCEGCEVCARSCPAEAISVLHTASINENACIECLCCMELCPHDAIYEQASMVARTLRWGKNLVLGRLPVR